ncbi:MAG: cupin domain-containing protein [Actinobacteria bacterium]|nr:cupin domain-containing protein [Actinomycetota bacterium]
MENKKEPGSLDLLGRFPISGAEARKNKRLIHIPQDKMLKLIHGKDNHILVSFFVSNDFVHFGKIQIPVGIYSDPEVHGGDEVLFVLKGKLTVQVYEGNDEEDTSVLHESYEILAEEQFFIPEGAKHRYLNFSGEVVEAVFGIAPEL